MSTPDGRVRPEHDLFRGMRQAGMMAAMSGDFDPSHLTVYAELIRQMPQEVHALRDQVGAELERLSGDPRSADVASMVITLGLIGSPGELSDGDLRRAVAGIGSELSPILADRASRVLMGAMEDAAGLRAATGLGPDPDGLSRMVAPVLTQDLDRFMRYQPDLVRDLQAP
jgi:hypothetical protein